MLHNNTKISEFSFRIQSIWCGWFYAGSNVFLNVWFVYR